MFGVYSYPWRMNFRTFLQETLSPWNSMSPETKQRLEQGRKTRQVPRLASVPERITAQEQSQKEGRGRRGTCV